MTLSPAKLTIDVTVAWDCVDATRTRHADAVRLFELARAGLVELAAATTGYTLDVHLDPRRLSAEIREMVSRGDVAETVQLPYPGPALFPGPTAIPGHGFPQLHPAWDAVVSSWNGPGVKPGPEDRAHLETHLLVGRDVFITDDQGLLTMCRRLRDEHGIELEASGLAAYVALHDAQTR